MRLSILSWAPIPLVRVATIFCAGILLGVYQPGIVSGLVALIVGAGCSLVFCLLSLLFRSKIWSKAVAGIVSAISIFSLGIIVVMVRTESRNPDHIINFKDSVLAYQGIIVDHLYERKKSLKTTIQIESVLSNDGWRKTSGKVNLYVPKNSDPQRLHWGNHVIIVGKPTIIGPAQNPHEFDFKRFLTFKNIYHQHFVDSSALVWTGETDKGFFYYSAVARRHFTDIIKRYVPGVQEQAIALALVIGVTDGVDNELENAYSASGAMHVLAVSGLHIGILYAIILFILKPLNKKSRGKWLVAGISLVLLWSYSFVTGLSPSVQRAVTMFSFMALAKPLSIRTNIFNTLAGSAIILLLIDPYLIMSVGFQLSYLAVLGIIWIQRPLYLLWEANTWIMDQVWQITCVSIAAQLTTFSLGLLYFHQFPTYFLFSNLFVIPISFVVLVSGIGLLAINFIEPLANIIGKLLWLCVKILNEGVFLIERLPYSIINHVYVDVFQCWLIMGIVSGLVFMWQHRDIRWLYGATILSVALSFARWNHQQAAMAETKLLVYHVKGVSAIEFFDGGNSYIMADSSFLMDNERVRFHVRPNRLFSQIVNTKLEQFNNQKSNKVVRFKDMPVAIIQKPIHNPQKTEAALAVVNTQALWSVPKLLKAWPGTYFVLDGSCTNGQLNWLYKQKVDSARVYAVIRNGAYVRSL